MLGFSYDTAPTKFWQFTWETNWQTLASATDPEGNTVELKGASE